MFKATYDTNSNNIVDNSEALGGVAASSYATLTGSQALTNKSVNGVTLSTSQGTSNFLRGDGTYAAPPSGVGSSSNKELLFNNSGAVDGTDIIKLSTSGGLDIGGYTSYVTYAKSKEIVQVGGYLFPADLSLKKGGIITSDPIIHHIYSTSGTAPTQIKILSSELFMGQIHASIYNETDNTYQIMTYDVIAIGGSSSVTITEKTRTGSSALSGVSVTANILGGELNASFSSIGSGSDPTDILHANIYMTGIRREY